MLTTALTLGGRRAGAVSESASCASPVHCCVLAPARVLSLEHLLGAIAHRGFWIDDGRQRFVVHLDKGRRIRGCGLALGDHGHDGLSHEKDASDSQRLHRAWLAHLRKVGAGDDVDDPWRRPGRRGVDAPDPGAGQVAQHQLDVKQAG